MAFFKRLLPVLFQTNRHTDPTRSKSDGTSTDISFLSRGCQRATEAKISSDTAYAQFAIRIRRSNPLCRMLQAQYGGSPIDVQSPHVPACPTSSEASRARCDSSAVPPLAAHARSPTLLYFGDQIVDGDAVERRSSMASLVPTELVPSCLSAAALPIYSGLSEDVSPTDESHGLAKLKYRTSWKLDPDGPARGDGFASRASVPNSSISAEASNANDEATAPVSDDSQNILYYEFPSTSLLSSDATFSNEMNNVRPDVYRYGDTIVPFHHLPSPKITLEAATLALLECPTRASSFSFGKRTDTKPPETLDSILARKPLTFPFRLGGGSGHTTTQFHLIKEIGRGSFGAVCYALSSAGDEVAIKIVDKAGTLFNHPHFGGSDETLEAGLRGVVRWVGEELSALRRVSEDVVGAGGCPFVAPLLCAFADRGSFYMVMRMYPENLHQAMQHSTPRCRVPEYLIRLWAAELLVALEALHAARIVHRDVKPENVLISPSGHIALADFGLASTHARWLPLDAIRIADDDPAYPVGTPGYMAPEQLGQAGPHGCAYGHKVDMYAWALVILEMFIGDGRSWFQVSDRYFDPGRISAVEPRPAQLVEEFVHDRDAQDLLFRVLAPEPSLRPEWNEIRTMPYFADIDWNLLKARAYDPIYRPCLRRRLVRPVGSALHKIRKELGGSNYRHLRRACQIRGAELVRDMPFEYVAPPGVLYDRKHGVSCLAKGDVDRCWCAEPSHWHIAES
ncbi:kinase-like protein [Coniophora puteana RWD-64-598 SS2]|uniref:non-specific serine/threonine protein kinase n=1 Tax=Coniophora puteana (strain RWD-64-598) TaxID=741705 RepID=A0A5M3MAA4_CONPW|nr:kinase-like protein [Coniophora puteana RWD-64-598 SS2]EIW76188.1 kinase-like protein [Coniophora puteana RWD-64-598 SS2]